MNKRLPRELPLDVSGKKYLVGFFFHVKTRLKPTPQGKAPTPQSVYKVLRDERPSRALLVNIFENCPDLLKHPATSVDVQRLYLDWTTNGHRLPEGYGHQRVVYVGGRAADCR